jgi:hypothetical protein
MANSCTQPEQNAIHVSVMGIKTIEHVVNAKITDANVIKALSFVANMPKTILYDDLYCFLYFDDPDQNHYFLWKSNELITYEMNGRKLNRQQID